MKPIVKSSKLANVCYDIRGPVLAAAKKMEEEGHRVIKLNIGNPLPFGFEAPEEIVVDVIRNMRDASGYTDSLGLFAPRKSIMHYCQEKGIKGVTVEDIFLGNGVSELIVMAMQGLLNNGDQVLIPMPDYPLWTAAVSLSGGIPVHYVCDEANEWYPDLDDIRSKVTSNTKAIVVINPNNPTGALYPKEILEGILQIAREHQLIVFADEIYDKVLYDGVTHTSIAALCDDVFCVTFNGLSKSYRIPVQQFHVVGDVIRWYVVGNRERIEGLLSTWIQHVGKKRSIGCGKVARWSVEPVETWPGFPVLREGLPLRPLPLDWPGLSSEARQEYRVLSFPYWERHREMLAAVP